MLSQIPGRPPTSVVCVSFSCFVRQMSLVLQRVLIADGISCECSVRLIQAGLEVTETGKLTVDQLIPLLQVRYKRQTNSTRL